VPLSPRDYRPDIDGLRAVAVLSVVIYHLSKAALPGGFVGVDIFFVISGYLITRNLWTEIDAGRFSLAGFYLRRIRRIAPAFLVMTAATLAAGALLLLPEDLERLGTSAAWAALSLGNVYFWLHLDTSYFAAASDQEPLLHTWSLGVEEQFYALWPGLLLLVALLPHRRRAAFAMTAVLGIASFALGEWVLATSQKFAYYMLPTRAGELGMGALLALWQPSAGTVAFLRSRRGRPLVELAAGAGGLLIAYSLWKLDAGAAFPGLNAIYPCLGAALLMAAGGQGSWLAQKVLGWRPMVWIGLISYSLYLWHWPILAYLRYFFGEIQLVSGLAATVAMFLLAWASYRWVEQPARRWRAPPGRQALALFGLPTAALCLAAGAVVASDGLKRQIQALPGYGERSAALHEFTAPAYEYPYNCQLSEHAPDILDWERCIVGADAARQGGSEPRILLWGDSHAAHHLGLLGELATKDGFALRNATHSACPPVFGGSFGEGRFREGCNQYRPMVREALERGDYDTVLFGAGWGMYIDQPGFRRSLERTLAQLSAQGVRVVLLGQVPYFRSYDRSCELRALRVAGVDCRARVVLPDRGMSRTNRALRDMARRHEGVTYLDVHGLICRDGRCEPYLDGKPVYYDSSHLSMQGSRALGRLLAQRKDEAEAWRTALLGPQPTAAPPAAAQTISPR
jgi:peptidoglycan/LPS O-acetylase OafA/YrhL